MQEREYAKGYDWYVKRYFGDCPREKLKGEVNPRLSMLDKTVPKKIYENAGKDVKLIFSVRNPVESLYSLFKMRALYGRAFPEEEKELNLEELIACNPDFILASCGTDRNRELESTFEKMGLNAAYFQVDSFEDYLRMLKVCTKITGCDENYETYGSNVKAQVEKALLRADGSRPEVLYIRATGSKCKVKGSEGSVLGEMLANLDCENIADRENSLLEQLSIEAILQNDPNYIFVVLQSADPADAQKVLEATLLKNPAWNTLTAVREGRYFVMDSNLYNLKPNGRWGEAYANLADILYPAR